MWNFGSFAGALCWLLFCAFCAFLWPAFLCGFAWREPEGGQRREIDGAGVVGDGVVATIGFGVGVEDEIVVAFAKQLDAIAVAGDGGEVTDADDFAACVRRAAQEGDDVFCSIVDVDPIESSGITIGFPQRALWSIESIQIAN